MTKILISTLFIVAVLTFYGCKKNDDSQMNYYITMDIDNKSFSFSDSLFAFTKTGIITTQADKGLSIIGYGKTSGRTSITISSNSNGTYPDIFDPTSTKKAVLEFSVNAILGQANNGTFIEQLIRPDTSILNAISVTVSNSNSIYIEGTFSGALRNTLGPLSILANGHFRVPFK